MAIAYIPTTNQFAVRVNEAGKAAMLFILSRTGQFVRTMDLTGTGIRTIVALTFFNPSHPSGGQFFIVDGPPAGGETRNLAFVTDFNGQPLMKVDYRGELGVLTPVDVSTITTGPTPARWPSSTAAATNSSSSRWTSVISEDWSCEYSTSCDRAGTARLCRLPCGKAQPYRESPFDFLRGCAVTRPRRCVALDEQPRKAQPFRTDSG